jgi:hypothetical protein
MTCQNYVIDINLIFKENQNEAIKYLDKVKIVKYFARGKNARILRNEFDELVKQVDNKYRESDSPNNKSIIDKWQSGECSGKECLDKILTIIKSNLDKNPESTKWKLMENVSTMTFTGNLAKIMILDEKVLKTIIKLKNDGNNIYVAGNMDEATFNDLKTNKIFEMITDTCISSMEKVLKPDQNFYATMVNKFSLNPFNMILIERENDVSVSISKNMGFSVGKIEGSNVKLL